MVMVGSMREEIVSDLAVHFLSDSDSGFLPSLKTSFCLTTAVIGH